MGPRPNGRGKHTCRRRRDPSAIGFNGAAAKRPRKAAVRHGQYDQCRASMGPRPNGRGKAIVLALVAGALAASMGPRPNGRGKPKAIGLMPDVRMLQWGRGQTAAESGGHRIPVSHYVSFNGAAAKRPRKVAGARKAPAICAGRLQWGRGQTAAESLAARAAL